MSKIRLVIEYDGKRFSGWQIQPQVRTIQGELHAALCTVLRTDQVSRPIASGRTDAGVSARRQVVCFEAPVGVEMLHKIQVGVSSILKSEVSVLSASIVADEFHPVRDVVRKQYSYAIWNHPSPPALSFGSVMHVIEPLDIPAMRREASCLIGEHDFSSFRGHGCGATSPVRTLERITIERDGDLVVCEFQGKGFLKQMVRNLVGTLVEYGRQNPKILMCKEVLEARDRRCAGVTAEPWGLTLDWVEYPEGRL
ncbi:MAG: tRNA pseudouridine(38-40) synthase TruA [Bdellovibrionota bacterium]|jgi:tRNA pseudouridine38-40 synthase